MRMLVAEHRDEASQGRDCAEISAPAELGGKIRRGHRAAVSGEENRLPFPLKRVRQPSVPCVPTRPMWRRTLEWLPKPIPRPDP